MQMPSQLNATLIRFSGHRLCCWVTGSSDRRFTVPVVSFPWNMEQPQGFEFPLAKAEYLLTCAADPGQGGDKQNFWQKVLGFTSATDVREALLAEVSLAILEFKRTDVYGNRFEASIQIAGPNGAVRQVRTVWIVLQKERIARFVTAYPDRKRRQS